MDYVSKKDFKIFGYYRIVLGAVVLAYYAMM
jgi:undecaprenyl-diphosphatase